MKKACLITLIITTMITSLSAGGVDDYDCLKIDFFEQSFNFYYHAVDDTVRYVNDKGKDKFLEATVNVSFYDIDKDTTFNIFDDAFKEKVVAFFYESQFVDSLKSMIFVETGAYYSSENIMNNSNISKREVSDKIFIVTYSFQTNVYSMWTCNKEGKNLQKFTVFDHLDDYRVDVFNKSILTIKHVFRKSIIDRIVY